MGRETTRLLPTRAGGLATHKYQKLGIYGSRDHPHMRAVSGWSRDPYVPEAWYLWVARPPAHVGNKRVVSRPISTKLYYVILYDTILYYVVLYDAVL